VKRHHSSKQNQHFILASFLVLFGGLAIFFFISLGVIFLWLSNGYGPDLPRPPQSRGVFGFCLFPFVFLVLAALIGGIGFRRVGKPVAALMSAADSVAQGDLSVRLEETGARQFRELARSFNHMTTELERAEQQRRNLTADIAHELRTPLHIIQGNLEGIMDGVYEPNRETLSATLEETRLLARLVADLQTLSLAEAGQLPLHPTRFLVSDLLEDAATSFAAQAAEHGVEVRVQAALTVSELFADYDRLDQVLCNLIGNALRYTPSGGSISLTAQAQTQGVCITVTDTGTGIPAADLPYIFDRFWKGDRSRRREGVGSGLGLAIARQLVRAHNGTIRVDSHPGTGTTFTIELPVL